jgi:hypothetical protein
MDECIANNKRQTHKFVLIEKINNKSKEMTLWDILKVEYGFTEIKTVWPLSKFEKLQKKLGFPIKNRITFSIGWLISEINGNKYEVYFDHWSVTLYRNGYPIFDKTRFENEDFLQLLI